MKYFNNQIRNIDSRNIAPQPMFANRLHFLPFCQAAPAKTRQKVGKTLSYFQIRVLA